MANIMYNIALLVKLFINLSLCIEHIKIYMCIITKIILLGKKSRYSKKIIEKKKKSSGLVCDLLLK